MAIGEGSVFGAGVIHAASALRIYKFAVGRGNVARFLLVVAMIVESGV